MRSTPSETRSRRKSSAKRKTPSAVFTGELRECAGAAANSRFTGAVPTCTGVPMRIRVRLLIDRDEKYYKHPKYFDRYSNGHLN